MASKRAIRRKVCERKQAYATEEEAAVQTRVARFRADSNSIGWYRCKFCHQFHIGHRPAWLKALLFRTGE